MGEYNSLKYCVLGAGAIGMLTAAFLGEIGKDVSLICRGDNLTAVRENGIQVTLDENAQMTGVTVRKADGETETVPCDGLFVAIGLIPENEAFAGLAELNQWGYFDSGESCETKTPGVYVAGDCRSKGVRPCQQERMCSTRRLLPSSSVLV